MPRDVELGEGYENGVMIHPVAPGQHVGHYNVQDGSSSLLQQEDSGVGAPPHHHHHHRGGGGRGRGWGGGWGWGPGYVPYEPLYVESIILDRTEEDDEDSADEKKKALASFSGLGAAEVTDCINRIVSAAAIGAREAIKGVQSGVLKDLNDVCNHIRRRVCAEVQSHQAVYAKAVKEAIQTAFAEAKPHVEALLSKGARGVSGFEDLSDLSGTVSSSAEFAETSRVQNHAIAIQAAISGIGKEWWNWAKDEMFEGAGWKPKDNFSYDNMMAFWLGNVKAILVYPSKRPTIEQVREVERLAQGTDKLLALVMGYIPSDAAAQGASDRAKQEQALAKSTLKSPEEAASAAFKEEFVAGAKGLLGTGIGVTTVAAIAAGLMAAWYFFFRGK